MLGLLLAQYRRESGPLGAERPLSGNREEPTVYESTVVNDPLLIQDREEGHGNGGLPARSCEP